MQATLSIPANTLDSAEAGSVVLLVEDEVTLARAVSFALRREGFRVRWAGDGMTALEHFRRESIDLILLDLMLPVLNGLQVCRMIRKESLVPVLILTARTSDQDKVAGFEAGADDYLIKPFNMPELLARSRALLRRGIERSRLESEPAIRTAGLLISPRERSVLRNGKRVALRPREFELLVFLARHAGKVFSRRELLERVWQHDRVAETRTVDVHVHQLRVKLESEPSRPALFQTVRGVGYRMARVDEVAGSQPQTVADLANGV